MAQTIGLTGRVVDFASGLKSLAWYQGLAKKYIRGVILDTYSRDVTGNTSRALQAQTAVGYFQGYDAAAWSLPETATTRAEEAILTLHRLGYPTGGILYLDCEDAARVDASDLAAWVEAWATVVTGAGFVAGMYVGAGWPMTPEELYALPHITSYWKSVSTVPTVATRGYAAYQVLGNVQVDGELVDVDILTPDYLGDIPMFMTEADTVEEPTVTPKTPSTTSPTRYALVTVRAGMTVWGLCNQYHTTLEAINAANHLTLETDRDLRIGMTLRIPT